SRGTNAEIRWWQVGQTEVAIHQGLVDIGGRQLASIDLFGDPAHRLDDIPAATIVDRQVEPGPTGRGGCLDAFDQPTQARTEPAASAQNPQAYPTPRQFIPLPSQIGRKQGHQPLDFVTRSPPVLAA